jgi:hypothetical protein
MAWHNYGGRQEVIDWNEIETRVNDTRIFYHPDCDCTIKVSTLRTLLALRKEVEIIAAESTLPDGDGVNMPTLLWAESWARK